LQDGSIIKANRGLDNLDAFEPLLAYPKRTKTTAFRLHLAAATRPALTSGAAV